MKIGFNSTLAMVSVAGALLIILIADTAVSYQLGTRHTSSTGAIKLLATQGNLNSARESSIPNGPNINFGSFTIAGTVQSVVDGGVVLQTAGGDLLHVLIDQHSSLVSPSGKPLTVSKLVKGNLVSVVARVNTDGQFLALRIIQQ